jgi:branched-chain amino acid transport system ATP-binding protein
VQGISVRFGGITALSDVSFDVGEREICGIIGPNGAGKTTLFNCLSRFYTPSEGEMIFGGQAIGDLPRWRMANLGIGRTFQNLALFPQMSVRQNISIGGHRLMRSGFIAAALQLSSVRKENGALAAEADRLMDLLDLRDSADTAVKDLPFGTQKRVELGRALASRPRLLLLDEPAAGLNHGEVETLIDLLLDIRERFSLSVLLVEHHMNMVMRVSDRVVALDFGRKIADDLPTLVQQNPEVIRAYLGAPAS